MTVRQSWIRQWYLSLGATAQVQFYGIYFFLLRGGQRAAAAAAAAATAARASGACLPACFAALCLHAVLVLCAICASLAVVLLSGATVGCSGRMLRSTGRQTSARAAATRLIASVMHERVNARLLVRVPVHDVGESDRPSRVYSDRKYIFVNI